MVHGHSGHAPARSFSGRNAIQGDFHMEA